MKWINLLTLMAIVACTSTVVQETVDTPEPKPPVENVREQIKETALASDCASYHWKNRGKAPKGYMQGMAIMYAKQVCGQGSAFIQANRPSGKNSLGNNYEDALAHYNIEGNQLNTYTFLIGLGLRESTGKYCEGRDVTADWKNHQSAEAGTFQMAYVSRVFNEELQPLYEKYKKGELDCELETFKEGVKCSQQDFKNFGDGEGTKWQELVKKCPALSAQWAAILIRSQYRHFGPIKRKEAEYKKECQGMLEKVEKVALKNCSEL